MLQDPRHPGTRRYLRRLYRDPMTDTTSWGLVMAPEGGIMGVFSRSEDVPLKTANFAAWAQAFTTAGKYYEWQFVFRPTDSTRR